MYLTKRHDSFKIKIRDTFTASLPTPQMDLCSTALPPSPRWWPLPAVGHTLQSCMETSGEEA